MKSNKDSDIVKKAKHLFQSGKVQEALQYYAACLWREETDNTELLFLWLGDKNLVSKAGEQAVCAFIASILFTIDQCEGAVQEQLWALCKNIFDTITVCENRDDTTDLYVVECNLYRHMHEPEKALEVILKGLSKGSTTSRYAFAGLTYLDLEDEEEAEKYIALGYQSDPDNASAYNDLGDYYFNRRHYQKAGECYYKVLESDDFSSCCWAEPSWIFCNFMFDGNPYELERLVVCAAADMDNNRAQDLCQRAVIELLTPNVDYLDSSSESIMNLLRSVRENNNTSSITSCACSCQESASSINALRLAMQELTGEPSTFTVLANSAQNPPLDETIDNEGIMFWNYPDINTPLPIVAKPSDFVSGIVRELAETDFSLSAWYETAKEHAAKLSKEQCEDLYGVMVYPPKQHNSAFFAEDWLFRVQFAAVCILAHISLHELDKLCKGQLDWPIIPAFTLAAWLASQDATYTQWAENILHMVQGRIARENYCFFEYAFTCAAYLLPGKDEEYYVNMWQWRQRLLEG